jgi:hypothetical protein
MTREELTRLFPHASEQFLRRNATDDPARSDSARPVPVPESPSVNGALATRQAEARDTRKRIVRITSFRARLLDDDNVCGKFHTDAIRYCRAGILPDDAPGCCEIITSQIKVATKAEERTRIVIELLP